MITKNNYKQIIIIVVLFFIISKFYNFSMWSHIPYVVNIRYLILFLLPVWAYYVHIREEKKELVCEKYIRYFIFVSIFTTIIRICYFGGALIGHDLELNIFMLSIYSTYYLLHHYKISEHGIIVALTIVGFVVFIIQVYQNLFPENALFGISSEEVFENTGRIALERNGLYRFVLLNPCFFVFLLSYYWCKISSSDFNRLYFFLFLCWGVQIYLMLTRQYFIASIGLLGYTIFQNSRNQNKKLMFFILGIVILMAVFYFEELFETLFDTKSESYTVSSTARIETVPFLLSRAFSNPLLLLTGHGYPLQLWIWGEKGFWWSDIGVIGQIIPFGLIWVVVSFKLSYIIIVKRRESLPIYVRAYTFGMLTIFYMTSPYGNAHVVTFVWVCILYICDLYLSPSKNKMTENSII